MLKNVELLKVNVKGTNLYKNKQMTFDLLNQQRITLEEKEMMNQIFLNNCIAPVNAIVGVNATGKSTTLQLLMVAINLFVEGRPVYRTNLATQQMIECFFKTEKNLVFETYLYHRSKNEIIELTSELEYTAEMNEIFFKNEILKKKPVNKTLKKKEIYEFGHITPEIVRKNINKEKQNVFITDDLSIISMAVNNKVQQLYSLSLNEKIEFKPLIELTDTDEKISIIKYFDTSIASIRFLDRVSGTSEDPKIEIVYDNGESIQKELSKVQDMLSSGTIRGIRLFSKIINCLRRGGYLLVDEIENNFNKAIIIDILKIFSSKRLNKHNATLIFTTHYAEILDTIERNDAVYIMHKQKSDGIQITRLSEEIKRNDINKSELILSDYLNLGTAPSNITYNELLKFIESKV